MSRVSEPITNRQTPNDAVITAEMRPTLNFILIPLKVKQKKVETLFTFLIKDSILLDTGK